ncbi:hypothetical protein NC652_017595 [Populus alba x Populus x berolinensis]|nr:hypothetical protein NC652_017595 [Populus alba x Populus x berolinensis]
MACLAKRIQMTMLCMTLFWRRGKRNLTRCEPSKRDENGNGLANPLLRLIYEICKLIDFSGMM